jgi:hypothetical protein
MATQDPMPASMAAPSGEFMAVNVIFAAVLCPSFAACFVGLRLYTARAILNRFHTDDCRSKKPLVLTVNCPRIAAVDLDSPQG